MCLCSYIYASTVKFYLYLHLEVSSAIILWEWKVSEFLAIICYDSRWLYLAHCLILWVRLWNHTYAKHLMVKLYNCFFLQAWLQRYGYLHHTQPNMAVLRSAQTMKSAIAAMQRKYGLNITGTLDKDTIEWVLLCTHYIDTIA